MKPPEVFDRGTRKRLAFLQNAFNIEYTKKINTVWTASFKLPYSDAKNIFCESLNYVLLWEKDESNKDVQIGLFRILPQNGKSLDVGETYVEYQLEHVFGTLIDDTMIGWHEIGNLGVFSSQVISYILSKQTELRWAFDDCDYNHQYLYGWQDENLLSAMLSITKPFFESDYMWTFNTEVFPWRLSLIRVSSTPIADVRYRKNLKGFSRKEDPTKLTTRLYCYGFGQGDNKLNIQTVNDGLPYLESTNIVKYGIITQVWSDERYMSADTLKAAGQAILSRLDKPIITYNFDMATYEGNSFKVGDLVRVVHEDMDERMIVQEISKTDVSGAPKNAKAIFGPGTTDLNQSFANLAERQRIKETYSQGAESLFINSESDNADPENPLILTFNIPETVVHVNDILFNATLTAFRAYSKGVEFGGGVSKTGESGGGVNKTGESGGGVNKTGESGGAINTSGSNNLPIQHGSTTFNSSNPISESYSPVLDHAGHRHPFQTHYHSGELHTHPINIPAHTHPVKLDPHTHPIKLDPHTHPLILEPHIHDIEYGIFLGPIATSMSIYLDNILIGNYNTTTVTNLNLIASMSKDANGKILRGNHTIRIVPNSLTRIECMFQIRLFTNSLGGKQY